MELKHPLFNEGNYIEYNNYKSLPIDLSLIRAKGSEIKLASYGSEIIAPYWEEFGKYSNYKVLISNKKIPACLQTKNGDKVVGVIIKSRVSSGHLILCLILILILMNFTTNRK